MIGDSSYRLKIPKNLQAGAAKSKIYAYLSELFDRRALPEKLGGCTIIRPEHRFFPHVTKKIYKRGLAFASDEPYTYLTAYANSTVTLSDRVHACVATLAYGNRAMLFTPSPRSALFERVGVKQIKDRCVEIEPASLNELQKQHIDSISNALSSI